MNATANSPVDEVIKVQCQRAEVKGLLAGGETLISNFTEKWSEISVSYLSDRDRKPIVDDQIQSVTKIICWRVHIVSSSNRMQVLFSTCTHPCCCRKNNRSAGKHDWVGGNSQNLTNEQQGSYGENVARQGYTPRLRPPSPLRWRLLWDDRQGGRCRWARMDARKGGGPSDYPPKPQISIFSAESGYVTTTSVWLGGHTPVAVTYPVWEGAATIKSTTNSEVVNNKPHTTVPSLIKGARCKIQLMRLQESGVVTSRVESDVSVVPLLIHVDLLFFHAFGTVIPVPTPNCVSKQQILYSNICVAIYACYTRGWWGRTESQFVVACVKSHLVPWKELGLYLVFYYFITTLSICFKCFN